MDPLSAAPPAPLKITAPQPSLRLTPVRQQAFPVPGRPPAQHPGAPVPGRWSQQPGSSVPPVMTALLSSWVPALLPREHLPHHPLFFLSPLVLPSVSYFSSPLL